VIAVDNDQFEKEEAQRRFEAALRGARAAEPHPMKEIPRKRIKKEKSPAQRPGSER
jgi:hypothetical protein